MARGPRVERPGAWHHVAVRGNERKDIFRDDRDRLHFCQLIGQTVEAFGWIVHAYALMNNHFHLLVETPEPNLGRGMQWLNTSYCVWFNRRHQRVGHLLQGRFTSVVVDPAAWGLEASRYVHLNPVRIGSLGLEKGSRQRDRVGAGKVPERKDVRRRINALRGYRWSSYRAYLDLVKSPPWLKRDAILELGGFKDGRAATDYRRHVESALRQGLPETAWEAMLDRSRLGAAALMSGRRGGRSQGPQRNARPSLQQIIGAVERTKGEKWDEFRNRHGDWGRDLVLLLGRKRGALPLRALGEALGLATGAVAMAAKRASDGIQGNPALSSAFRHCEQELRLKCVN